MHLSEKKIYAAWKSRFAYPTSPLEGQAAQFLGKISKVSSVSGNQVRSAIQKSKVIIVGDDASLQQHQKMIRNLISHRGKTLLISNRTDEQVKKLGIKSKKLIRRPNISQENTAMAKIIATNEKKYDRIVVWTGHLRISTKPFQELFAKFNPVFVALQSNDLRWAFHGKKGWILADENFYVNLDSSPLVSVDFYRSMDEHFNAHLVDSKKDFSSIQKVLALLLRQKKYRKPKKIISVFDSKGIDQLNSLKHQPHILRFIKERVMLGESAVMPEQKLVLLSTLNQSHIAEEAAHYLRLGHRKNVDFGKPGVVVEEALAFFASLLLFPSRPIPKGGKRKTQWDEVHIVGYYLGFRLWKIWQRSKKSRELLYTLWSMYPTNRHDYALMLSLMQDMK